MIAAAAALFLASFGAQAAVLTFDNLGSLYGYGVPSPDMNVTEKSLSYTEQGFTLTLWTPNAWYGAHIGDAYYNQSYNWHDLGANGYGSYVTLTRNGGGAFDLTGFDYGDYSQGFTISARGYGDVTLGGTGRNAMKYLGVSEVVFSGYDNYTMIDNLEVAAVNAEVPEPGSAALLLAGFGLVGAMARRRKA
jgi:hypothetical protein